MTKNNTNYYKLLEILDDFSGITDDSREVQSGFLFVAGGGGALANKYIDEAINNGAKAVVGPKSLKRALPVTFIETPSELDYKGEVARSFFKDPSKDVILIGVTGTCGKTTTTYLLESIFLKWGKKVGVIGTENYRYGNCVIPSVNTTPGIIKINKLLNDMKNSGCQVVVMEVSSHALVQKRVEGLLFDGAIFTNLTHDHLDIHQTMENYFQTKSKLFLQHPATDKKKFHAVINTEGDYGKRLYSDISARNFSNYQLDQFNLTGVTVLAKSNFVEIHNSLFKFRSDLIGSFNAENILGAVTLAKALDVPSNLVVDAISEMGYVPGRMNRISYANRTIVVDYAHKPGALFEVASTLRSMTTGNLIIVFGCGGARDQEKRPEMGRIAARLADYIIVTSDNQRGESIESIMAQIVSGITSVRLDGFEVIDNRRKAIEKALGLSKSGDLILIAGRGTESKLNVYVKKLKKYEDIEFDDMTVAKESFQFLDGAAVHSN